ncbi:MAG: 50S ribosomal protein L11 [Candidatus Diapherotrites archaeon]|nr:50S ribosomal protein L11 [Candidatus Diapherotrites archaeon]
MPESIVEALVEGGKATAGPPLGPGIAPLGINVGKVVAAINEKTKDFKGMQVPVKVIVDSATKDFRIEVGSPPATALLKKEGGIKTGSGKQKEQKAGDIPIEVAIKVARMKQDNMLAYEIKTALREVLGSAVSLGITVEDKDPREVQKEVAAGQYDDIIEGKTKRDINMSEYIKKNQRISEGMAKAKAEAKAAGAAAKAAAAAAPATEAAATPEKTAAAPAAKTKKK